MSRATQTTCSRERHKCIHFSTNCCYGCVQPNTYSDLSDQSVDVEFIFVPEDKGGLNLEGTPIESTWTTRQQGWSQAIEWAYIDQTQTHTNTEYKYDDPVAICLTRPERTRGPKLKGYLHPVEVCNRVFDPNKYPPYIYAFESSHSSLKNFQMDSKNIYLVKIGVPGHYTLGVIKIDPFLPSIDFEFFDSGGYEDYFPGRNQCLIREQDDVYLTEKPYLLAAICAYFRSKFKGFNFNFLVVNSLNIQILKRDQYCQTWILMYIYFKYILNVDEDFVLWLQNIIHQHGTSFDKTSLDIISQFGEFITNFPEKADQRIGPLRSNVEGSWGKRICAMNINMQKLIQMVNNGNIQEFLRQNSYYIFDKKNLAALQDTYIIEEKSQPQRHPQVMRAPELRRAILAETFEDEDEDEDEEKKKKIKKRLRVERKEDLATELMELRREGASPLRYYSTKPSKTIKHKRKPRRG